MEDLTIRRITPKEAFRLMGLRDEDIKLVMEHQSEQQSFHLAGDSIVTTVLMRIIGNIFDVDWQQKFKPEEWWKNGEKDI